MSHRIIGVYVAFRPEADTSSQLVALRARFNATTSARPCAVRSDASAYKTLTPRPSQRKRAFSEIEERPLGHETNVKQTGLRG